MQENKPHISLKGIEQKSPLIKKPRINFSTIDVQKTIKEDGTIHYSGHERKSLRRISFDETPTSATSNKTIEKSTFSKMVKESNKEEAEIKR